MPRGKVRDVVILFAVFGQRLPNNTSKSKSLFASVLLLHAVVVTYRSVPLLITSLDTTEILFAVLSSLLLESILAKFKILNPSSSNVDTDHHTVIVHSSPDGISPKFHAILLPSMSVGSISLAM